MIFWDFLMFDRIFLSTQVKQCAIITYKHDIYEFPYELPNNVILRLLGNFGHTRKISKLDRIIIYRLVSLLK